MPITPLPIPPSRQDPTNFNDRADAFLGALPQFQSEANDLQTDVNAKQVLASNSATQAQASANAAASTANVSIWISGTTYSIGDNRFSPIDFKTYRRKTNGAGTTDPSVDNTNWQLLSGLGDVSTIGNQTIDGVKTFTSTIVGDITGRSSNTRLGGGNVASNIANGTNALNANTTGAWNTAIGVNALSSNTTGNFNTAVGAMSLNLNSMGESSTAVGYLALSTNIASGNTAVGRSAMQANEGGYNNTAIGSYALANNTGSANPFFPSGFNNTAVGNIALRDNTTASYNTAVGQSALMKCTTSSGNTAIGTFSLMNFNYLGGDGSNTAVGYQSLSAATTGIGNCSFGRSNSWSLTTGSYNSAFGISALFNNVSGDFNTAVGYQALDDFSNLSNCTGLGNLARVTGSNQVQLGNSSTTTYVFGTVQNRSDLRDKTEVRDTVLGLDFINALRPVDYKWDMRDDYKPERPQEPAENATEEEKAEYKILLNQWLEDCKHENIVRDGSKKRNRYHHGLIAQEVKSVMDSKGIDFGGYQDHKIAGGNDVLSIGYDELIAPLIKAVQELTLKVKQLEDKLSESNQP